ncbi:hypothetical protein NHQ30_003468 [Ciborinia camelliae]|nr:hypothetical protein NHQ30_003468 [Ciborinia camelliae]
MDSASKTTAEVPPKGWTYDPTEIEWSYFWNDDPDCEAKGLEYMYGIELGPDSAIMCRVRQTGQFLYMIKSNDGKFYLWNMIESDLVRIDEPTNLDEIISAIKEGGLFALKTTVVPQVPPPPQDNTVS